MCEIHCALAAITPFYIVVQADIGLVKDMSGD